LRGVAVGAGLAALVPLAARAVGGTVKRRREEVRRVVLGHVVDVPHRRLDVRSALGRGLSAAC
jgi:hypothetical protein